MSQATPGTTSLPADGLIEGNAFGEIDPIDPMNPIANTATYGGALFGCDGTIVRNMFRYNHAAVSGGAMNFCGGLILSNFIADNSAGNNGGALAACGADIRSNIIWANTAGSRGGGLRACGGLNTVIEHNTIYANDAGVIGGGALADCVATTIRNNILWKNTENGVRVKQIRISTPVTFSAIDEDTNPNTAPGNGNIGPFTPGFPTGQNPLDFVSTSLDPNPIPDELPTHNWGEFLHLNIDLEAVPPILSVCVEAAETDIGGGGDPVAFRDFGNQLGPLDGDQILGIDRDIGADEAPSVMESSYWWSRF